MAQTIVQGWHSWTASDFASLADAVAQLGAGGAQLVIERECVVSADLTIPASIAVAPTAQGMIRPANGVTVVIERMAHVPGPFQWIDESDGGRVVVQGLPAGDRRWRGAESDQPTCPFAWGGPHPLPEVYFIDGDGRAVIDPDYDVARFAPARNVEVWVDAAAGSDANPGTEAQPKASVNAALGVTNVDTIYLHTGAPHLGITWTSIPSRDISFIAYGGGRAVVSAHRARTWSKTSGRTNVYQAVQNGTPRLWLDAAVTDADGDYYDLVPVASVAACDATPGSYYHDTTGLVYYVHTADSRPADADVWIMVEPGSKAIPSGITVYLENIESIGGARPLFVTAECVLIAKGCHFKYSTNADGLEASGAEAVYLQDCVAARNETDGLSYRPGSAFPTPHILEINCVSRYNGVRRPSNEATHNGSTGHGGAKIVRINGTYHHNRGPNVVDVGGAMSWNVGVESRDSIITSGWPATQAANFFIEDGEMWIEGGTSICRPNATDPLHGFSRTDVTTNRGYAYVRGLRHTGRLDSTALADPPHVVGTF